MIQPTVGRVLWFHPAVDEKGRANLKEHPGFAFAPTCAAIIAGVVSNSVVNLTVFDSTGVAFAKDSVNLIQDDEDGPATGNFAEWMPYQKGQAAKTEDLTPRVVALEQKVVSLEQKAAAADEANSRVAALEQRLAALEKALGHEGNKA